MSLLEKKFKDFKFQYNKQSVEELLNRRAVKTTEQVLFDKGLFDSFPIVDKVFKDYLFVTIRRPDLENVNDGVIK